MKKIFILFTVIAFSFFSNAQNILSITDSSPIDCSGGTATILVTTDATVTFNYQLQAQIPSGAWVNASLVETVIVPPSFFSIAGLFSGNYRVILIDFTTGVSTDTVEYFVTQPLEIQVFPNFQDVSCFGLSDGEIDLNVFGGTAPLSYSWSNGAVTEDISGLAAGTYTCDIFDANGCAYQFNSLSIDITEPLAPLFATILPTDITCFGFANGEATITSPTGGTPTYSYEWNTVPVQTTAQATGLSPGTYTCTITDFNGCELDLTTTVDQPSQLTAIIIATSNYNGFGVSCNGGSDGTATASGNGGTPGYTYLWSDGQTTAQATGLSPGTYTCTVTDANGCPATTSLVTISEPPLLSAITTGTSDYNGFGVSCNGGNDGTATASGINGVGGYTYSWNTVPVQTTAQATGLTAGTYTCTVTDANGCPATTTAVITEPVILTASNITSNYNGFGVSCNGENDGTATASGINGVGGYTYSWNTVPVQTTAQATGLTAGTYTCTVIDANGCPATTTAIITEPTDISYTINAPMLACKDGNDGIITITPSGGVAGYTYSWNNGATTQIITGLTAGTYVCTITDANGCLKVAVSLLEEPPTNIVLTTDSVSASCNNGTNGSASVIAAGGFPSYTYLWSDGQTTATAINLAAGTYTINVTDANNCTVSQNVIVDQPDQIIPNITSTPVSCYGGSNGTATANPTGGTGPYTYEWNNAPLFTTTSTVTGLSATTYTVTVTDALNCPEQTETVLIAQPDTISALATISNVSCTNFSDGEIVLSVTGGNGGYTFLWSNGQTTQNANNLGVGTYSVVITDATSCNATFSYQVTEPLYELIGIPSVSDVLCYGESTGSITINPQGGTPPYDCFWPFNNQNTFTLFQTLPVGTYTAELTDANGCNTFATATINQPDSLTLVSSSVDASCFGYNDGSATVTADGGVLPYTYNWSNGQSTQLDTMLSSGTYNVIVFDSNNCPATMDVVINEPNQINATTSTIDILCNGAATGVITVNANGGAPPYIYSWSNGHNDPINQSLSAGTYSVTVFDGDGCFNTFNATLFEPSIITATLVATDISVNGANDGTISAAASGGNPMYSYSWSGPNNFSSSSSVINGLSAGIYTLTVQDANGCEQIFTQFINEPFCNVNIDSTFITPLCFGDLGMLSWYNSGGLAPYTNTLINSNGQIIVNGDQYDFPNSPLELPDGVYDLVVTDAAGCNAILNIPVIVPDSITIDLTLTDVSCFGLSDGTATAVINGGTLPYNSIDWGAVDPNILIAGDYNVMVTDVNGCTSDIVNYTINEPIQLEVDSVTTTLVSCVPGNDGTATAYVSGGVLPYTYNWSNGQINPTAQSLISGNYVVNIIDGNGCLASSSPIFVDNAAQLDITVIDTPITCYGANDGVLVVNLVSGSYPLTYSWFDLSSGNPQVVISSDSMISNLSSGGYQVLATDVNGCIDQETVLVTNPSSITFQLPFVDVTSNGAMDGIINTANILGGQAPYSFYWVGPNGFTATSQNINNLDVGMYTLTITDANGCESVQSEVINQPGCDVLINLNINQPLCFGDNGSITWVNSGGVPSYDNVITDLNIPTQIYNSFSSSGSYSLPVGNYMLQVTDQYGCSDLQNIEISEPEILVGNYITSPASCFGGTDGTISVTPSGGTAPYSINYGGVDENQLSAGVYTFELTDNNGCESSPALISYQILEPNDIVASLDATLVDCFGGDNGTATVTAIGGTAPYSYSWSPSGDTTAISANLTAGTYYVTIIDGNGCSPSSGSYSIFVLEPALELTASIAVMDVSCYSYSDGVATITPSGGTAPYTYLWSNGETTNQITNLLSGNYSCVVTDKNQCSYTDSITVNQPDEILANLEVTNVTCNGDDDGSALVNPTGGSGTYNILWYNNITANSVSFLAPGSYTVEITDDASCSTTSTPIIFNVTEPDNLTLVASELNGTSCIGYSDGAVTVDVNGGTPSYTYNWLDSLNNVISTDSFAINLSEGNYSVVVGDINGCINFSNTVFVSSPLDISVAVSINSTVCNGSSDGSATAIPSGGTAPYTYLWTGGMNISTNATYSSLDASTTYYVTVIDANNCVSSGNPVNIDGPVPIASTFSSINQNGFDISCSGADDATVTINSTGGTSPYSYSLDSIYFNNDSTFINVSAGWLVVYIVDSNGCTSIDSVEVTEPAPLDPNINILNSVTCTGGNDGVLASIVQGGIGGFFYAWSNMSTGDSIAGLSEGTYMLTVTDANLCTGTDSVTLVADFDIQTNSSTTPISCTGANDGIAAMQPTGGTAPYTYLWNTGSTNSSIQGLGTGIYWCAVSDVNGCSVSDTFSIVESPTSLEILNSEVVNVSCNGGSDGTAKINATGGSGGIYSYQWNDINSQITQTAVALNAGTFIVSVTDSSLCTVYDTVVVNEPDSINIEINHLDISCYGSTDGVLASTVSGGIAPYSYSWIGPNSYSSNMDSISSLELGEYILTIIDNHGCVLLDTSVILEPAPLTFVESITNPSCFTDSNGEVNIEISGGNIPYSVIYGTFIASYPANNLAVISNLPAGSDTLYVYDANGCENSTYVNLVDPNELIIDSININNPTCFDYSDGVVSVNVSGGLLPYIYQLTDNNTGLIIDSTSSTSGLSEGTYEYQIIDVNGCVVSAVLIVEDPDEIEIVQESSCYGSILVDVLNTLGNYQIFWGGDIPDSIFIDNLSAGEYNVTVIDDAGCVKVTSFEIGELINYSISDASCLTASDGAIEIIDIYEGNPPYSLNLNNSLLADDIISTYSIDNLPIGNYSIRLVDADGCSLSDSVFVDYIGGPDCINIPVVISPNNDGVNDSWHPIYDVDTEVEILILNRWGKVEFYYKGNSIIFEWDGLNENGDQLPSTDYYYIIKFNDNAYSDRTGVVTLIR